MCAKGEHDRQVRDEHARDGGAGEEEAGECGAACGAGEL